MFGTKGERMGGGGGGVGGGGFAGKVVRKGEDLHF